MVKCANAPHHVPTSEVEFGYSNRFAKADGLQVAARSADSFHPSPNQQVAEIQIGALLTGHSVFPKAQQTSLW